MRLIEQKVNCQNGTCYDTKDEIEFHYSAIQFHHAKKFSYYGYCWSRPVQIEIICI